jgi:uncharacterized protein
MPTALPQRLDLARLADARAVLDGELPLARLDRLVPLLARVEGVVRAHLEFGRDLKREVVKGRVESELLLTCQRCFGEVRVPVVADLDLVRVADEDDAEALADGRDPLVAPNREVEMSVLLEDELLLALPIVPLHADPQACARRSVAPAKAAPTGGKENPFAALAALKTKSKKN